ncbi:MAG: hypothetical protein ACN2B6_12600 [Rickettsiales bacterium]
MDLQRQAVLTLTEDEKGKLWGILHHHINMQALDMGERYMVKDMIKLLDPDEEYARAYQQSRT